jgi:hypothetical protein
MTLQRDNLTRQLEKGNPIELTFQESDAAVNTDIREVIALVCEQYRISDMADVIYGCVKELVINATKANLKRAFFHHQNLDIHNMGHYVSGLVRFRTMLDRHEYREYFGDVRQMGLWVKFIIRHNRDGIVFEVVNNTAISEVEEGRVRLKLKKAMKYDDILTFYNREQDAEEGAGIGIALVVILLKSASLDPDLFRIGTKDDVTSARIELPLTGKYRKQRKNASFSGTK